MRPGESLIDALGLTPHPEGGWYRRTWVAAAEDGQRPAGSAIYYLLLDGESSAPHRIDATEIWHHYAGAPLRLEIHPGTVTLGPDLAAGQRPQAIVPPGVWQAAETTGAWTLVGCTVSPGFTFDGFELAPPGWAPA